jgi:Fe/S biogenesis protein NfuA
MPVQESTIVSIDEKALAMLLGVRDREPDASDLGLVVGITGVDGDRFTYEMSFMRIDQAAPDDHVATDGELPIIASAGDVETLRGATLMMSRNLLEPGLVIDNPNSPSPTISTEGAAPDLSGSIAEQVVTVVREVINPAIASHGGFIEVAAVEPPTVYVRLGGGCQGCGMASVTLSQGIESTVTQMVPEISKVVDVTDHQGGTNPYYEQAKK